MRKTRALLILSLLFGLLSSVVMGATYKLTNGQTVTGEIIESGSNDSEALIKTGGGPTDFKRVSWSQFSQEDLKAFKEQFASNPKIVQAVDPFIEITPEERAAKTEVTIKPTSQFVQDLQKGRLEPKSSVVGSLFKSGLGLFLVLLIYGANIYAGYEISIFRANSAPLVAGLAAIPFLGFVSNIVFLSMPTRVQKKTEEDFAYEAQEAPTFAVPGQEVATGEAAAGHGHAVHGDHAGHAAPAQRVDVFKRGQFTFNKRFFETKFASFFGVVRREEDKAKVLVFKTTKGEFVAQRITRITASEVYIQADRGGGASVEMSLGFPEIQEVNLTHPA